MHRVQPLTATNYWAALNSDFTITKPLVVDTLDFTDRNMYHTNVKKHELWLYASLHWIYMDENNRV